MSLRLDAILCATYVSIKMATTDPDKVVNTYCAILGDMPHKERCELEQREGHHGDGW